MTIASIVDHGTTRDGLIQLRRRWEPTATPRAAVLLVHGLGEHSGRYERVGGRLAEAGFFVVSFDNRGFGASGGPRAWVETFEHFYDDVEDQLREVRQLNLPTLMIGHSLGGAIAVGYCLSSRPQPDALALSGPALDYERDPRSRRLKAIAPFIRAVMPMYEVRRSTSLDDLAADPAVGQAFADDPLTVDFLTVSLGLEIANEIDRIRPRVDDLSLPIWVGHGADDRNIQPEASEVFESMANARRVVYEGLRHEIFFEPEGLDIIDQVSDWASEALGLDAQS